MRDRIRIHGDNIVECERLLKIIKQEVEIVNSEEVLISPSTIACNLDFLYEGEEYSFIIEMLPGFNKSGRKRWEDNIFNALKSHGSYLDETPDAIVSRVEDGEEYLLFAVEFCSALQAGNQAWQRSGRAYSTGRTGCPYLYIVDFVKYELDSKTRERKALRFPNPAVPYSYINYSRETGNFVAQVYVKSEEFDKSEDAILNNFDEDDFAGKELAGYIVKSICKLDTEAEEQSILNKNFNVVMYLSSGNNADSNFTSDQWEHLYSIGDSIIDFSVDEKAFIFHKIITAKGHHGKSSEVINIIDKYSIGLASKDLPIGIIPKGNRASFARAFSELYPSFDRKIVDKISSEKNDLLLCLIKGFKPRGDDNRPDRGILPLAAMLADEDVEIMTYIYGPVIGRNLELLLHDPIRLAEANGLWRAILSLSNYVALDVPVISGRKKDEEALIDAETLNRHYLQKGNDDVIKQAVFSSVPTEYHEDDVDTGIHFLFARVMEEVCFEGMCNPPGGDWSGLSVIDVTKEYRWLSLPRVSKEVDGKRPDHVIQLFGADEKPVLLVIESKENSGDLESNVGEGLKNYIKNLMTYIPSVQRIVIPEVLEWKHARNKVEYNNFTVVSAAAYLKSSAQSSSVVFNNSKCDMLFVMEPQDNTWEIDIITKTERASALKEFILSKVDTPLLQIR